MRLTVAEKAIDILHITKGVENAFFLDECEVQQIIKLEKQDEETNSLYFGKKHNIGVKQALRADVLIAFVTNKEYDWPRDNLKIMYQGETIGKDVSDASEIKRYKSSDDHCVFGNIVINYEKVRDFKDMSEPPLLVISGKPCKEIEDMAFVSEALIASPSRLTDDYIRSKFPLSNELHVGSFLLGLYLENNMLAKKNSSAIKYFFT
ncbi:hypothetical protein V7O62_10840 [Methanolobus sp. ZRKC2]|uniref:hypothetical protein n=1 Tax=Methanolobus sp. ZRKC2 TaxID=3125783 RepID=UPI0032553B2D